MPRFNDDFLNELRMRSDIEQVISSYVQLRRRGKNLVGLCPFHNEKTPSFTVYPENQSYFCFGCGAGGEAINFIMRAENLDFTEAVKFLCDRAGMTMPSDGYDNSMAQKRRRIYEINKEAARFFNSCLYTDEGKAGLDYFKMRGYRKGTITKFGLGYATNKWDGLLRYMREKGYSYEELYEANLANRSEKDGRVRFYDSFRNRVMVPIIDVRGNVVAFGGRVLDDSKPKYINSSDTPVYKKSLGVFGLNFAKNSKEKSLILVEGYMDAISLHQAGFDNVIACLGTALTSEMAHLLSRYCEQVVLSYDADEAGQKATVRAIDIFNSIGMKLKVIHLSGGKDPDEILRNYGAERFRSLIEGAANDIEFAFVRLRGQFDITTSDGKMKFLEKAAEVLANTKSHIAQDIYASRLGEELSVSKDSILVRIGQLQKKNDRGQQVKKYRDIQQNAMRSNMKQAAENNTELRSVKAEEMLIAALMRSPELLRSMEGELKKEDFTVSLYGRIFSEIEEKINEQRSLEFKFFSESLQSEELSRLVSICKNHEHLTFSVKGCADCLRIMRETRLKKESAHSADDMSDEAFMAAFNQIKK